MAGSHSVDAFLGGLVVLLQPLKGHRAGLDAALLQALVPTGATGRAVDLGAGVGTVAFALAARAKALAVTAIERDPGLVDLGRKALKLPGNTAFSDRVSLIAADVATLLMSPQPAAIAAGMADFVLMNPPFDSPEHVRASPDARRSEAHVGPSGLLDEWCRTAVGLLKPRGRIGIIHRAEALPAVLQALSRRFGEIRILPVHPAAKAAAIRILVTACLGSRAPLRILPGLVLHESGGSWTPRIAAVLEGRADLAE